MKRCGHCLQFLRDDEFHKRGDRPSALASWCKTCTLHGRFVPPWLIDPAPLAQALTNWRTHERTSAV